MESTIWIYLKKTISVAFFSHFVKRYSIKSNYTIYNNKLIINTGYKVVNLCKYNKKKVKKLKCITRVSSVGARIRLLSLKKKTNLAYQTKSIIYLSIYVLLNVNIGINEF